MNNKEYLEQISTQTRQAKKPATKSFFGLDISPKLLAFIIGGVVAAILIIIIGSIAGSGSNNSERDLTDRIYQRANNLSTVISDFSKRIKSSELRSMSTSLNAVLTETTYSLTTILENDFGSDNADKPAKEEIATVLRADRVGGRIWVKAQGAITTGGKLYWVVDDDTNLTAGGFTGTAVSQKTVELSNVKVVAGAAKGGLALIELGVAVAGSNES